MPSTNLRRCWRDGTRPRCRIDRGRRNLWRNRLGRLGRTWRVRRKWLACARRRLEVGLVPGGLAPPATSSATLAFTLGQTVGLGLLLAQLLGDLRALLRQR